MVVEIKEFSSLEEVEEALDKDISITKSALGDNLRRLDEVRDLAEKAKKLRQVISKVAGRKAVAESNTEIDVDGLTVVLQAGPVDELDALESAVRSHQERLLALQKARAALKPLEEFGDTDGITFLVVETKGIPETILLKLS